MSGLYNRLEALSVNYQTERREIETGDLAVLIIKALCECLHCDLVTLCDPCDVTTETIDQKALLLTANITTAARGIADSEELDIEIDSIRVGRLMRSLRFEHAVEAGTHKKGWRVSKREVARFAQSFGLASRNLSADDTVTNVTDGHNVTVSEIDRKAAKFKANTL